MRCRLIGLDHCLCKWLHWFYSLHMNERWCPLLQIQICSFLTYWHKSVCVLPLGFPPGRRPIKFLRSALWTIHRWHWPSVLLNTCCRAQSWLCTPAISMFYVCTCTMTPGCCFKADQKAVLLFMHGCELYTNIQCTEMSRSLEVIWVWLPGPLKERGEKVKKSEELQRCFYQKQWPYAPCI